MFNLLLVRHAQSEWNALGRWQGQADPPLSLAGEAQARAAAAHSGAFDAIMSSTLTRAMHTAAIISSATGIAPVLSDQRWIERNVGEYQGLTHREISERFGNGFRKGIVPAGWEDDASLIARALEVMSEVHDLAHGSGDVLVVTHGGVIYAVERHLGSEVSRIPNLGGRWVHRDGSSWQLGERVELAPATIGPETS